MNQKIRIAKKDIQKIREEIDHWIPTSSKEIGAKDNICMATGRIETLIRDFEKFMKEIVL